MDKLRFNTLSEALYTYGASDLNEQLLQHISLDELFYLTDSTQDQRTSFRAAWALEHILFHNRVLLQQNRSNVLDLFARNSNWSCLRSLSKLTIEILASIKQPSQSISEQETEKILEKTFSLLEHNDCPIAVRCNAYDIIYLLQSKYEGLAQELSVQIEFDLEKNKTPALLSRGLKILKKLNRQR